MQIQAIFRFRITNSHSSSINLTGYILIQRDTSNSKKSELVVSSLLNLHYTKLFLLLNFDNNLTFSTTLFINPQ